MDDETSVPTFLLFYRLNHARVPGEVLDRRAKFECGLMADQLLYFCRDHWTDLY